METKNDRVIIERLRYEFSDIEKSDMGLALARLTRELEDLAAAKKEAVADIQKSITETQKRIRVFVNAINDGYEIRPIKCAVRFNQPMNCQKEIVRLDSGELVRQEPMNDSECQDYLPAIVPAPQPWTCHKCGAPDQAFIKCMSCNSDMPEQTEAQDVPATNEPPDSAPAQDATGGGGEHPAESPVTESTSGGESVPGIGEGEVEHSGPPLHVTPEEENPAEPQPDGDPRDLQASLLAGDPLVMKRGICSVCGESTYIDPNTGKCPKVKCNEEGAKKRGRGRGAGAQ